MSPPNNTSPGDLGPCLIGDTASLANLGPHLKRHKLIDSLSFVGFTVVIDRPSYIGNNRPQSRAWFALDAV